jgi:glycyl-tRNA synthetase alpha chain
MISNGKVRGCLLVQPYNSEVGAGTYNPADLPARARARAVERRLRRARRAAPSDGRYGDNPNRLQQFHQFQVILKPSPLDIQDLYLESLRAIGTKPEEHDVRFIEDDWESPTLGAWGLGWQVWLDGLEISQFTYFQQVAGSTAGRSGRADVRARADRDVPAGRRQHLRHVWWSKDVRYGEICKRAEWEWSTYNFEQADVKAHFAAFDHDESEAKRLLALGGDDPMKKLVLPAYDFVVKAAHAVQRARRARRDRRDGAGAVHRARAWAGEGVAEAYLAQREAMGFPLLVKAGDFVSRPSPPYPRPASSVGGA